MPGIFHMILAGAVISDCYFQRIPNQLILFGLLQSICLRGIQGNFREFGIGLLSVLFIFVITYPFYLLRALGAGDIKLFCVISSYLGFSATLQILIASLFIGAVLGVIHRGIQLIKEGIDLRLSRQKKNETYGRVWNQKKKRKKFCYAPAILFAYMFLLL